MVMELLVLDFSPSIISTLLVNAWVFGLFFGISQVYEYRGLEYTQQMARRSKEK